MNKPEAIRSAVLAAGVVISTLACLAVGTLLDRSLQASSPIDDPPLEAVRNSDSDDLTATRPDLIQMGQPLP
ncbi:MAG: hypothetical protein HKN72_01775 [Gemmatimonadetes bacterium]|nr:hypothetical protein [Gemmatimonadota bacterium]NNF11920.1 hypothetical protein [Gemmatimonadota bacterium]